MKARQVRMLLGVAVVAAAGTVGLAAMQSSEATAAGVVTVYKTPT